MFKLMDAYPPVPESVTNLLTALADQQRQRILQAFFDARLWELPASEIAERCAPLSRPAVSHHLGIMRRTNVLTARRDGRRILYTINRDYVTRSLQSFQDYLDRCCPVADTCEPPKPRRRQRNEPIEIFHI